MSDGEFVCAECGEPWEGGHVCWYAPPGEKSLDRKRWEEIRASMRAVLAGGKGVEYLLDMAAATILMGETRGYPVVRACCDEDDERGGRR
jgi:hypothetical protein